MSKKHDNLTLSAKVMLRQTALRVLGSADPVIVETHGGRGDIWSAVYRDFPTGAVFEKDPGKADLLAMQRPTWAVYESDVEIALAAGAARHLTVDLLDVDPYGAAWPTLQAFFGSTRPLAPRMVVVINDGLRFTACGGAAWRNEILAPFAARYGNHNIWYVYPDKIAPELLATAAASGGYTIAHYDSYTTGVAGKMVHILAVLERDATAPASTQTNTPATPPTQTHPASPATADRATPHRPTPNAATT